MKSAVRESGGILCPENRKQTERDTAMKINGASYYRMTLSAANALDNNKTAVNNMNVFPVPDGDTGINMTLTLSSVREIGENTGSLGECAKKVADLVLRSARGNSGAILSLFFRGIAKALAGKEEADTRIMAQAFARGSEEAYKAVMNPTEGTILTVMRRTSEQALEITENAYQEDPVGFFAHLVTVAEAELARTPELLPVLRQAHVVDAGGYGFVIILSGMLASLEGKDVVAEDPSAVRTLSLSEADFSQFDTEDVKYAYCTECIVEKNEAYRGEGAAADFYRYVTGLGDSAVFIDDESIIKLHIHTNNPGLVLEKALVFGSLSKVKIENMKIQHSAKVVEEQEIRRAENTVLPIKPYGSVAVCMGEGIRGTFRELGVDQIVYGGQTMNPSTQDILNAIEQTPSETVFVFPNNKNIELVAETAAELCQDRKVVVIPSRNVPQGISALLAFDEASSVEENVKTMKEAMSRVTCITTTHAIRDSSVEGLEIHDGQAMGLVNEKIRCVADSREECIDTLTDHLENVSFVTVFYGNDVTEKDADKVYSILNGHLTDDAEIVLINGGQPVYDYIISLE